ncbi:MAG TPA: hypothetical protein VGM51_08570 [Armatimonadota bacterium]|jgi:prepilin-type processing-associated H-X9-DG protein
MINNWHGLSLRKWGFVALAILALAVLAAGADWIGLIVCGLIVYVSVSMFIGVVSGIRSRGITRASLGASGWLGLVGLACLTLTAVPYSVERWDIVRDLEYAALLLPMLGGAWSLARYFLARAGFEVKAMASAKYAANVCGIAFLLAWFFAMPLTQAEHMYGSRKTKSFNNIKQLWVAEVMYSQDYSETFPGWVRNPDGAYAHNCWDEQINSQLKAKDAFNNGDTGIRSYSDPTHRRVLTYGLNGLLIAPPMGDGNADFTTAANNNPPAPSSAGAVGSPAETILFAELTTNASMPGVYGRAPDPIPFTGRAGKGSSQWRDALYGWIDISPRAFIEIVNDAQNHPYREPYGLNADRGVARDFYGGGGVYAFCDGHAAFLKVSTTVGIGTTTTAGLKITEHNCWSPDNMNNMWVPR